MARRLGAVARLQQTIALAIVAGLAVCLTVMATVDGAVVWGLTGLALLLVGHSAALGVEFMYMRRVNRGDEVPPSTLWQVVRAWWAEVLAAPRVFLWQQPFHSLRWPDFLPRGAAERRGVVLVHGFLCNRGFWNRWMQRLHERGVPFVAVNLEPVFGPIESYAPYIGAAVDRLLSHTGKAPVVVAHSMGGLAVRHWLLAAGHRQRVHGLLTIGTPHRGTRLASLGLAANARQMRIGSAWLRELAQREQPSGYGGITCYFSHCDNIAIPASMATLPGADNRHLPGAAHVDMVDRDEPFDELLYRLR